MRKILALLFLCVLGYSSNAQFDNCDCEWDFEEPFICAQDSLGDSYPVPNACFAECYNLTIVEDSLCSELIIIEDPCADCDEDAWSGEGICIEVDYDGETYVEWVPSECWATCFGFEDFAVVECDSTDIGDPWEDPCADCDEDAWSSEGICIEVDYDGETFVEWVPSECWATCFGFEDFAVVECDSIDIGDPWEDPCADCDEDAWSGEGICIEVDYDGETFVEWVPSECWATCFGFEDFVVIECDSTIIGDPFEDDCDCEYDPNEEPICVLTDVATGTICPFPNLCVAECAGYSEEDVVDCGELPYIGCLECLEEEINPVCVQDSLGNIFPMLNECFADCLGLEIIDSEECGEGFGSSGGTSVSDIGNSYSITHSPGEKKVDSPVGKLVKDITQPEMVGFVFPNPAVNQVNINLDLSEEVTSKISVINAHGQVVKTESRSLIKGQNSLSFDISNLIEGIYFIRVENSFVSESYRFIKS